MYQIFVFPRKKFRETLPLHLVSHLFLKSWATPDFIHHLFNSTNTTSSPTNPILNTNCWQLQKCTRTRNCTCTCTFIDQRTPQSFSPKAISRHKFHQIRNVSVSSRKLSCSRVHHMRSTSVMCTYVSYVAMLSLTWKSPLGIRTVRNQSSKSTPLR